MKVALVHDYLTEYGGAERVLETLHEMYPTAPVFTSLYNSIKMPSWFKTWDIRTSFLQKLPLHFALQKLFTYILPWVFESIDFKDYDLVVSSTSCAAHGLVLQTHTKHIVYCHTPPKFAWMQASTHPRNGLKSFLKPLDWGFQKWDFAAAQRPEVYVANSSEVQYRIKEFYTRDSVVVYPPIEVQGSKINDQNTAPSRLPTNEGYYLVVSRLEKLKNIDLIIRACLRQNRKLKIAGKGRQETYLKSISDSSIEFLGFVPDAELPTLYANATALVLAAESEDFGMTPVEAHLYGCPVLAFNGGGYRETVVEGLNGHFYKELNIDSLENGLHEIEAMTFDRENIKESAKKFSKERFMSEFQKIVQSVIDERITEH